MFWKSVFFYVFDLQIIQFSVKKVTLKHLFFFGEERVAANVGLWKNYRLFLSNIMYISVVKPEIFYT
jgi:hypothetical protein